MRTKNGRLRSESYTKPYTVDVNTSDNEKIFCNFAENIDEVTRIYPGEEDEEKEERIIFIFDRYTLTLPFRTGLAEEIKKNPDEWLKMAKEQDFKAKSAEVRAKRNALLEASDNEFCIDRIISEMTSVSTTALTAKLKELSTGKMAAYRQALRDITKQPQFPYNVIFPIKPN